MVSWSGLLAPQGTPSGVLGKLNAAVAAVVGNADLQEKLTAQGYIPQTSTEQAFADYIRTELVRFRKLVKAAGLPVE